MSEKLKGNKGWQLEQECLKQEWMLTLLKSVFPDSVAWKEVKDVEKQNDNQDVIVIPRFREPFVIEIKFRFVSEKIRSLRDMSIELWKDIGRTKGWPLKEGKDTAYLVEIIKGPRNEPIEDEPKEIRVIPYVDFHNYVKGNFDRWMNSTNGRLDVRKDKDNYPRFGATKVRYRIPLEELKMGIPSTRIFQGIHARCHSCGATEGIKPGNLFWSCEDVEKCVSNFSSEEIQQ